MAKAPSKDDKKSSGADQAKGAAAKGASSKTGAGKPGGKK